MKINKWYLALALGAGATAIAASYTSCVTIPKGAKAVRPFDKDKYLGQWYEIARLDFKFEKNLDNVTANYSLNDNGSIKVDNKGYDYTKNKWKESVGKAKFVGDSDNARLKVSFFGPFYAGYNVIAVDKKYQYALVVGNNLNYLWILSREKTIPDTIKTQYLQKARNLGYDTDNLVWTKHDKQ
ncbi:lipocalin family protein [Mucilaginibacter polytrichastri]|uniref:Outer membrane lipoprotein Blc n=1 Tax=Mucilaginibacter polytrichastri TaxID=1302689 RepID=A0A1Q6A2H4_9SPHI|nr:lipocalin family protein [Mucilaginibacter polytrichastri]OKS88217.1 Outer membrane lipoprotein blc [Mucilaginibacter polytrichastri]SFT08180.1 apolipoprotein D and lipocalin family protein [Mucilaginibacter polytrichastri]